MLQGLKNTAGNIANLQKMRQQQAKLQKLLQTIIVTGTSKNGKVVATITGEQKIIDIKIDPSLVKFVNDNFFNNINDLNENNQTVSKGQKFLADPIKEAIEDAMSKVQGEIVKKMQESGNISDFMSILQGMGSM